MIKKRRTYTNTYHPTLPTHQQCRKEWCTASCALISTRIPMQLTAVLPYFNFFITSLHEVGIRANSRNQPLQPMPNFIAYDDKCITNGGNQFTSYPDTTGHENKINNNSLRTFQDDHLLFNVHYGRSNKIKNDKEDAARKLAQEETVKSGTNLFNLEERVRGEASAYALLVAEFQPCGGLCNHTIVKGLNQGKKVKKQKWSKINHLILFLISLLFVFLSPFYYIISHRA